MKITTFLPFLLLSFFCTAHNDTGELLCFEYNNVDLDVHFMNDEPMAIFPFVNCSGHVVSIERVVCNNSKAKYPFVLNNSLLSLQDIQPGTRDTLKFKRWHYSAIQPGLYDNSWTIYFKNDTVEQHLNIFIELQENYGVLKADTVYIDTVKRGEKVKFSALVYNTGTSAVKITSKYYKTGKLKCLTTLPQKIQPGECASLAFELETENLQNFYTGKINFDTNEDGYYPRIGIPYQGNLISKNHPSIKFDSLVMTAYRKRGEGLTYEFWYENNGDEPLLILMCKGSCGCIVPSWSKEPLMPGERDVIKVKYDTKRIGPINKSVSVHTNASDTPIVLRVKGMVEIPKE